jgi:hypothetical protein
MHDQDHEPATTVRADAVSAVPRGERPRRSRCRAAMLLLAVVVVGSSSACASGADGGAAAASPVPSRSTSSSAASPSALPSESPSPSPTGGGPVPTPGPAVVPKVIRPGQPSKPTISAPPAAFKAAVTYPDGIKVKVAKVVPGVETGHGAGVFAGRQFAVFTVTIHNGTARPMDLQQVVLTSTYGPRNLVAERVYAQDAGAADFGGSLAPGADATARYAFAVPTSQLGDVRLIADFDGVHTSAEFTGDARQVS